MMQATTKTDWLIALRSGEYRQGKYVLRNQWRDDYDDPKKLESYEFCPLGLLCHITKFNVNNWYGMYPKIKAAVEIHDSIGYTVLEFEGIKPDDQIEIAGMNDDGKSFLEVADWIEQHIKTKD